MTAHERAGVTPAGIRDGRPEVLRALVTARGSAVLAYCRAICLPEDAGRAAAEAFARFRAAVVDAPDVTAIDPDILLLGATRHAAASLSRTSRAAGRSARAGDTCAVAPGMLAARAAGVLGPDEAARLDAHLERCPGCRGLAEDFDRAEEAYRSATAVPVPAAVERMILGGLEAAAPVLPAGEPPEPAPLEPDAPAEDPSGARPADPIDDPVAAPGDDLPHGLGDDPGTDRSSGDPFEGHESEPDDENDDDPFGEDDLAPSGDGPYGFTDGDGDGYGHDDPFGDDAPLDEDVAPAGASRRSRLPRLSRPSLPTPGLPRRRPRERNGRSGPGVPDRDLRPILLPGLVILAALLVTLIASGVFSGDEAEPPKAQRQPPELRVEQPVTTPLPVQPVPEPEPPAATAPPETDGTETAPGATETTPGITPVPPETTPSPQGDTGDTGSQASEPTTP